MCKKYYRKAFCMSTAIGTSSKGFENLKLDSLLDFSMKGVRIFHTNSP